jgi:hypothetical protein
VSATPSSVPRNQEDRLRVRGDEEGGDSMSRGALSMVIGFTQRL